MQTDLVRREEILLGPFPLASVITFQLGDFSLDLNCTGHSG